MRRKVTWAVVLCLAFVGVAALDSVASAQEPLSACFWVGKVDSAVSGEGWPAEVELTLTADDPTTQENPDILLNVLTDDEGDFHAHEILPGVAPGWFVTVTDGLTLKTHVVTRLSITGVDAATETVWGIAEPFGHVWCNPADYGDAAGAHVTAGATGEWLVDFSGDYDILPGSQVNVLESDDDGDDTFVYGEPPRPEGWQYNPATDHHYLLVQLEESTTWQEAEAYAVTLGGHLVTINDAAENAWLIETLGVDYWIGFNDLAVEGEWVWASGESFTFTDWLEGEPNDYLGEDVAQLENRPPTGWNDVSSELGDLTVVEVDEIPVTLEDLLDAMVADGRLPSERVAQNILRKAEAGQFTALTNYLTALVRRGLITEQTMDEILATIAG